MARWTGFAEFCFHESAHLALARAQELAATDACSAQPNAWMVDDRRITFSLETDSGMPLLEGTKRLLDALAEQAVSGEAVIEAAQPFDRWSRRAGASAHRDAALQTVDSSREPPAKSTEASSLDEYDGAGETIRTAS